MKFPQGSGAASVRAAWRGLGTARTRSTLAAGRDPLYPRQTDHPGNPTKTKKAAPTAKNGAQTCVNQSSSDSTPSQKPTTEVTAMQTPVRVQSSRLPVASSSTGCSLDNDLDPHVEIKDFAAVILKGKQSSSIFMAEVIDVAGQDVHLKYMKRSAGEVYIWPSVEDSSWEPTTCIVSKVRYPELANKREQFRFLAEDMLKIRKSFSKSLPFC